MHNARSGARKQHKDRDVLSPGEERGHFLKRYVRAAAALNEIYNDEALGNAAGVGRGAVAAWWTGTRMSTDTIRELADAIGLSREELSEFVYHGGPPPTFDHVLLSVLEGVRRAQARLAGEAPGTPPQQPRPRPRDSGAERG